MTQRLGFSVSGGLPPADIVHLCTLAERHGYESFWMAEGHGGDQFAILAACAVATRRIRLGTAISSVFVRSVPTIAMAAATLDDLSGGRFVLGLGSSHRVQVEPEHGLTYTRPVTRVRETVAAVRELLATGSITGFEGETVRIERFELWFERRGGAVPVYLAGLFPTMLRACGELADGLVLTRSTLDTAAAVRRELAAGAERAGRDAAVIEVCSLLPCAVADSTAQAYDQLRPGTATYAGFFPRYNRLLAESGFADAAAAIAEAWARGDRAGAERAVPDQAMAATAVAGTPEQCRQRLQDYARSGIDVPIISPRTGNLAECERALRECAPRAAAPLR